MSNKLLSSRRNLVRTIILCSIFLSVTIGCVFACSDENMRVTEQRTGNKVDLIATLDHCFDVTIALTAKLQNMTAAPALPLTMDSNGRRSFKLAELRVRDPNAAWHYNYSYHWKPGGRNGVHDSSQVYALPYAADVTHTLIQGYFGKFSHYRGSQDENALDWEMPLGSQVLACRAGTVVGVRSDSDQGGASQQFKHCANYIILKQSDGTYAEYLHLQKRGVLVKLGQEVAVGQAIGLSGSTGFSSRPHLHFAVFHTINGNLRETIPTKFRTKSGSVETLRQGSTY